ncbi:MAG: hypothetical protein OHK006_08580 [Thermodesulfovibrionales bacterium]
MNSAGTGAQHVFLARSAVIVLIACLAALVFLHLLRPFADNDFFWHLKTGQWIWENRTLPFEDPFSLVTPPAYTADQKFILTSYWLSQLILCFADLAGGLNGIVVLRFIIVGMLIVVMILSRRGKGDTAIYLSLLTICLASVLAYPVERPQFFSFLCFAILLHLLGGARDGNTRFRRRGIVWALPLLMLIWSNLHGGYIAGIAVILLTVLAESVRFAHPALTPLPRPDFRALLFAAGAGIASSLCNPNGHHAFWRVAGEQASSSDAVLADIIRNNVEYMSSVERFAMGGHDILLFWFFCALSVASVLFFARRPDITRILLLASTGCAAFMSIRYIPFFMIAALPFISRSLSATRMAGLAKVALVAISIGTAAYFAAGERGNVSRFASGNLVSGFSLPVAAADFARANDLKGNMFTFSDWGGYLMWRLGPDTKVFIDGRFLYPDLYHIERSIASAADFPLNGLPYWKATLSRFDITHIYLPLMSDFGETYPLLYALLNDAEWLPVFSSLNSMIFVRNSPENLDVIRRFAVPKDLLVAQMIERCEAIIKSRPGDYRFHMAKSDLYMYKGNLTEAREGYRRVSELAPAYELPRQKLHAIEQNYRRN